MQNVAENTDLSTSAVRYTRTWDFAFDLMISKEDKPMLPVIFLNREIPVILPRILREYERLKSESRLSGRLCGTPRPSYPAPLVSWYRTVLGNVLCPGSGIRRSGTDASFGLSCAMFTPEDRSEYYYIALDLPPLWKKEENSPVSRSAADPILTHGTGMCEAASLFVRRDGHCGAPSLFTRRDGHSRDTARLIFRYRSDTGSWYACIHRKGRLRNVFSQYIGTKKSPGA